MKKLLFCQYFFGIALLCCLSGIIAAQQTPGSRFCLVQDSLIQYEPLPSIVGERGKAPEKADSKFSISGLVFPNPAGDHLTVSWHVLAGSAKLKLCNNMGITVYQESIESGASTRVIDTSNLKPGLYFVELKLSHGRHLREKVIVQH